MEDLNVKKNNKWIPKLAGVLAVALVAVVGIFGINNNNETLAKEKLIDSALKAEIKDVKGNAILKEDLSKLEVSDLGALISSKKIEVENKKYVETATNKTAYIGEERAKEVALGDAGLSASNINFTKVELDYDDGRIIYEVEFYSEGVEYEYEIDAKTGAIIEKDIEGKKTNTTEVNTPVSTPTETQTNTPSNNTPSNNTPSNNTTSNTNNKNNNTTVNNASYIGQERAKQIAFSSANVSSASVRELKVELDHENGKAVYDVDFKSGNMEYDYEIDALSGSIIKADKEYDD